MKKNKLSKLFSLLLVFMALFSLSACQKKTRNVYSEAKSNNSIMWGVKADTRLFGLMDIKTGKIEGFEVDLANALTKKILGKNAKAEFTQTTAKTKLPLLKNGNIDAVLAAMTITSERKKQVDFSKPYFNAGQSLLVPDNSQIKNIKDLNGKTALAVKGTTAVANVRKFAPRAKVLEFDDYGQAFTALKAGQGQAMTTDNGLLAGIATENKGYKLVGGTYTSEPYGIAVNKGQKQLLNKINKALVELKKDGTYHKLIKKWFGNIPGFDVKQAELD
ncbi:transporter substrate-binding domain-containing protein [Lactobacillus hominis]|uniref:Amino acid ABC superfamily ATP binding cassette transporter, binding protein n=1 Tax=Lactobacillus hominis DSM 23910 = CRBIP 24.179 TaxID=1423758 RepID=I7IVX2_9LACO|nr:transporter substrate-binding domain-containing protein [Lactobacillus hominis]KRM84493.1 amino acid ABC superfamily ATP binding cassette transporter, binding protein [Lactobacillus hominis DSM 23910 = CRBIP 24.179]MCT3348164.1 glutamine ABC transporter substrate-binding protein [Lactobacillus hominis]CCI82188.1 Amino acid ABC superfamily ATP binding cassette transporter, binding protein [Lactobacillus hominis DSM 23910 = CRBIP 24.179]